MDGEDITPL